MASFHVIFEKRLEQIDRRLEIVGLNPGSLTHYVKADFCTTALKFLFFPYVAIYAAKGQY